MTNWLSLDAAPLVARSGAGVRVAVIDSGVAASHPHVGAVGRGTSLVGDDPNDVADRLGHGTAVFAAIRESAPGALLVPVRVLDRERATSARLLAEAIDWAVAAGVDVVNLSFGTTNEAHVSRFELALDAARQAGIVVVAPHSHEGTRWFPGSLQGAIGVLGDPTVPRFTVAIRHAPVRPGPRRLPLSTPDRGGPGRTEPLGRLVRGGQRDGGDLPRPGGRRSPSPRRGAPRVDCRARAA